MPPFLDEAFHWARVTGAHFLFMFWWIWLAAIALTAASESLWIGPLRRRVLDRPDAGAPTVRRALALGLLGPPSRRRVFEQARELLARGVSRRGVLAYLTSAQGLPLWVPFAIVALNGPQPVIGLFVAGAAGLAVLFAAADRMPETEWARARERARPAAERPPEVPPVGRGGPTWLRPLRSIGGQAASLWWPLAFGLLGIGFFLALGRSPAAFSLQGDRGPWIQLGNAGAGLLLAWVTGAPIVGNALIGAGVWKAELLTYAGLTAFYLGTLVMPFALPRYGALFGVELGRRVVRWLVVAIVVGALAATAGWWGLDRLAGILGVREWLEAFTGSTLRPSDVPWFHHWFAPDI